MGSQRLRLWLAIAGCCLLLGLHVGCSNANVARHSGEYKLDIDATERRSPESRGLFKNVVLTLKSDGSFTLKGKFAGVSRTDSGKWTIAGRTITLSFRHVGESEERFTKTAAIDGGRLISEVHVRDSDVPAVFLKNTSPAWVMSIFAVIMLVAVRWMYAHRESPNVSFKGGSPKFVATMLTVLSLVVFVLGIVGTFRPEVVVWATEAQETFSTLTYLGFLALVSIGIIGWAFKEEGEELRAFRIVLGLAAIALLVWLYFRFGVEFTIGRD